MQLSLDLLQEWLSKWGDNLLDLNEAGGYVDFSGLKSLKSVSMVNLSLFIFRLRSARRFSKGPVAFRK